MCPPKTVASMACPEVSRRNLLKFGLGAAAAALAAPLSSVQAAPVRRTTFSKVQTQSLRGRYPL